MLKKLNTLLCTPMEEWKDHGIPLKAVSANANGQVNSGITKNGTYFYRKWSKDFQTSTFIIN